MKVPWVDSYPVSPKKPRDDSDGSTVLDGAECRFTCSIFADDSEDQTSRRVWFYVDDSVLELDESDVEMLSCGSVPL
jgi:hypothetical protein